MVNAYSSMNSTQSKQPVSDLVRYGLAFDVGAGLGPGEPRGDQKASEGSADEEEDSVHLASFHAAS